MDNFLQYQQDSGKLLQLIKTIRDKQYAGQALEKQENRIQQLIFNIKTLVLILEQMTKKKMAQENQTVENDPEEEILQLRLEEVDKEYGQLYCKDMRKLKKVYKKL